MWLKASFMLLNRLLNAGWHISSLGKRLNGEIHVSRFVLKKFFCIDKPIN
jgi:hypothetical protein